MIRYVFIVFFLLLTGLAFSQTNSLIGKWEIVAINNGEVYYDFKKDSISILSDDLKEMYDDESKVDVLKQLMKRLYGNANFEFKKEVLKMEFQSGMIIESKYNNDVKRDVIVIQDKNSLNEIVDEEMQYKLFDNRLHLSFNFEETPCLFILEKVK